MQINPGDNIVAYSSMSGATYTPPLIYNSVFNASNYNFQNSTLANSYVKYPVSQGSLTVSGSLNIVNPISVKIFKTPITSTQIGYTSTSSFSAIAPIQTTTNTNAFANTGTAYISNIGSFTVPVGVNIINWQWGVDFTGTTTWGGYRVGLSTSPSAFLGNSTETIFHTSSAYVSGDQIRQTASSVLTLSSPTTYYIVLSVFASSYTTTYNLSGNPTITRIA